MAKYLHKILVPISEVEIEDATREDRAQRIVEYAENAIEPYRGEVFSSRWLACHGDRAAYYSEPVFYAADNLEWFIDELTETAKEQRAAVGMLLDSVKKELGTDLEEAVEKLMKEKSGQEKLSIAAYDLWTLAELLKGEYRSISCFYHAGMEDARIYETTIEEIRKDPSEWALVVFECRC